MVNIHLQYLHQSEVRCYQRSQRDYLTYGHLQTLQLPRPVPPGSRRHQEVHMFGNLCCPILRTVPYQLLQRFPVPENRLTYQHPGYASYPDDPADKIPHDEVSSDPPSGNSLSLPVLHKVPVRCVPWKEQNDHGLLSSDPLDLHSSLQNKDMLKCLLRKEIHPDDRTLHCALLSQYLYESHLQFSLMLMYPFSFPFCL